MTLNQAAVPVVALLLIAGTSFASAPVIGLAAAPGGITLNNSKVPGNATLFEGDTVQAEGYSRIMLSNGTRLDLAAGSKAQVFGNRETLESGMSQMQSPSGFEIEAGSLKIRSSDAASIARVRLDAGKTVLVTALNAPVNVMNKDGYLVAKVVPGLPFSFLPQAAASSTSFDNTGCILQKGKSVVLVDQTGSQIFELRSAKKIKFDSSIIGNKAHVAGAIDPDAKVSPDSGAQQVVVVAGIKQTDKGGCSDVATKLGASAVAVGVVAIPVATGTAVAAAAASTAAAAGVGVAAAGISTAVIVGGVAAAAAVGVGAAVAAGSGSKGTPSP